MTGRRIGETYAHSALMDDPSNVLCSAMNLNQKNLPAGAFTGAREWFLNLLQLTEKEVIARLWTVRAMYAGL